MLIFENVKSIGDFLADLFIYFLCRQCVSAGDIMSPVVYFTSKPYHIGGGGGGGGESDFSVCLPVVF